MLRRNEAVLTAAASRDLVSLEIVKDELIVSAGDIISDKQYSRYIAQISADIHNEIDPRVLPAQTYRNTFRWDAAWHGSRSWCRGYETEMELSQYPVLSLSAVTENGTALSAADYELDAAAGILRRVSGSAIVPWCASEIVVDFAAGYSPIPADIVEAALKLITIRAKGRNRDPMLRVQDTEVLGRQEFWAGSLPNMRGGMPLDIAQVIDRYRPVIVG